MPAPALLLGLLALAVLTVSTYFAALGLDRLPRLRRRLGGLLSGCGIDTSSCAAVARSKQARLLGGVPNALFGLSWGLALLGLALRWLLTGTLRVPFAFLVAAAGSLLLAVYLVYSLRCVLRQPCPL